MEIIGFLVIIALSWADELFGRRLHYLEEFVRVCAWCRKLNVGEEWIPVEEFFERKFETMTSHGMCPACLVEQRKLRRAS